MRRLLIINNIPTPYRTFMFNEMSDRGRCFGVEVRVAYQAEHLSYRSWPPNHGEMRFPHFTSRGVNPFGRTRNTHFTYRTFNTDILRQVVSGRYDWVLVAPLLSVGSWATALAPSRRTRKLLWSESNLTSTRFSRGPARWFKGLLESPFSALVCPGQRAVDYVLHLNPKLARNPVLWLPNIVDTSIYEDAVRDHRSRRNETRRDLGIEPDETVLLGIGQMVERKGYWRLIEAASKIQDRYTIVLLGEGPLRAGWTREIADLGLSERIRLVGETDPSQLARYLASADWFVHPALADPSPLVIVEAAWAGLPMAVSTQTGNAPEALMEGVNGFTFDASSQHSLEETLKRILSTSEESRAVMGEKSTEVAAQRFDPDTVIEHFFRGLLKV